MVAIKRFSLIAILALGFLVFLYQVGWSEPTPPPDGTALTDKKFVHWYLITVPTATGTEKVGHLKVIAEESTSSPAGIAAPKERIYKIYREAELTSPTTLPYVTMNEDSSFVFDASKGVFKITKISIRFVTADNKEINIKGSYANNKLVIVTSGSGVKAPVEWKEATESDTVSLLSESIMGVYLAIGGWKTQSHSCRLISPYCAKPFFESLVTVQGKEVIKGKEGEPQKEAYQCHLVVTDPDAFVKESDYLFEPNGFILKQTVGNVTITRSTYEEVFGSNKTFERKGRDDPFRLKMTRRVEKGSGKQPIVKTETLSAEETDRLIKEAEDNLTQMKKISDTLPDGLEKSEAMMKPYQNILRIENIIMTQSDSPGAKNQIMIIRNEAERLFGGPEKVYLQAQYLKNEAQKLFDARRSSKEIVAKQNDIAKLLDNPLVKGSDQVPKIQALINDVKILVKRKQIMESFAPPNITGLVYYLKDETVTLDSAKVSLLGSEIELPVSYMQYKPVSSVIVNNVICKEGSKVNEDTSIKTIKEKEVIFLYKGEEMPVEFKMK